MDIRFVSKNKSKVQEVKDILSTVGINVIPLILELNEIQTEDENKLVRTKLLEAFKMTGRPVIVEHTGLYIEELNGFPGGLTQIFWDKIEADKFCKIFGNLPNTKITAKTTLGYCDAQDIHIFEGIVEGKISDVPKGPRDFQWDCIFIPDGQIETFAEMGPKKNLISMRKLALEKLSIFLNS